MRAGNRRCLAWFYRDGATIQNSYGETTPERPKTVCKAWVSIELLSGRKLERANQVAAEATHMVEAIWMESLKDARWFEYNGRRFEINWLENVDERNRTASMLVKEAR